MLGILWKDWLSGTFSCVLFLPSSQRGVNIHLACPLRGMQLEAIHFKRVQVYISWLAFTPLSPFACQLVMDHELSEINKIKYAVQYDGYGYECVVSCSVDMGEGEASSSLTICTCRYWELLCFHH